MEKWVCVTLRKHFPWPVALKFVFLVNACLDLFCARMVLVRRETGAKWEILDHIY